MPKLRQYVTQTQVSGPSQQRRADTSDLNIGDGLRSIGQGMQNVGQAMHKREEMREVTDVNNKLSKSQAEWENHWRETLNAADPGDGELAERFTKDFNDHIDQLGEGLTTAGAKSFYQKNAAAMKAHFQKTAQAGQSHLAGVKAKTDITQSSEHLSSSLLTNPSYFKEGLAKQEMAIDALVDAGVLPRAKALEFKQQERGTQAKAAVRGWIKLNPEDAKEELKNGQWDSFLNGDEKKQLFGEADQEIRARDIEDARREKAQQEAAELQKTETQNQFLEQISNNELTVDDIMRSNLDPFGSGSKEQFMRMVEARVKGDNKTDPAVFNSIFERINLPDGDPNKITDENDLNQFVIDNELNFEDLNKLRGELQGKKTQAGSIESEMKNNFMKNVAKRKLTQSNDMIGLSDPIGDELYQQYLSYFMDEYEKQRQEGKSPNDLLNPASKDYLGNALQQFSRTPEQIMNDIMNSNSDFSDRFKEIQKNLDDGLKRRPGESANDYIKRVGI